MSSLQRARLVLALGMLNLALVAAALAVVSSGGWTGPEASRGSPEASRWTPLPIAMALRVVVPPGQADPSCPGDIEGAPGLRPLRGWTASA